MDALQIEISPKMREKLEHFIQLHDVYGSLLTERQNICFTMHYLEDLSLSEIGEALEISPQAVSDQLKRTVGILRNYEDKLGFIQSQQNLHNKLDEIIAACPLADINEMLKRCKDGF